MSTQTTTNSNSNYINYLKDVKHQAQVVVKDNLLSIILFGSYAKGKPTKVSDVDVIIVVSDSTQEYEISKLRRVLESVAIRHEYWYNPRSLLKRILRVVKLKTGMFVPFFVCRESDLINGRFERIFGVSKLLSLLLAPRNSVLNSIKVKSKVIYGKNLISKMKIKRPSYVEIIKSYVMNLLQSLGALIISPFDNEATKYSMEAFKWSIYTIREVLKDDDEFKKLLKEVSKSQILNYNFKQWEILRNAYRQHYPFVFMTPSALTEMYLRTLINMSITPYVASFLQRFQNIISTNTTTS